MCSLSHLCLNQWFKSNNVLIYFLNTPSYAQIPRHVSDDTWTHFAFCPSLKRPVKLLVLFLCLNCSMCANVKKQSGNAARGRRGRPVIHGGVIRQHLPLSAMSHMELNERHILRYKLQHESFHFLSLFFSYSQHPPPIHRMPSWSVSLVMLKFITTLHRVCEHSLDLDLSKRNMTSRPRGIISPKHIQPGSPSDLHEYCRDQMKDGEGGFYILRGLDRKASDSEGGGVVSFSLCFVEVT